MPMPMPEDAADRYQLIFFVAAAVFILVQMVRGWRLGVVRQLVHLLAMLVAYVVALLAGKFAAPIFHPLGYPDIIASLIAGLVVAAIVYVSITTAGAILFRRTDQQAIRLVRLGYGAGGSLIGLIVGIVTVWIVVVGIRMLGSVAEAEVAISHQPVLVSRSARAPALQVHPGAFVENLARMKQSLDHGATGEMMQRLDPFPDKTYAIVAKISRVLSSPESMARFLDYPGAKTLSEQPRIVALQNDPLIVREVEQRHYLDLLKNEHIVAAANDPEVAALVKNFDLEKALDYALGGNEKNGSSHRAQR